MSENQTELKSDSTGGVPENVPQAITAKFVFDLLKTNENKLNFFLDAYAEDNSSVSHSMAMLDLNQIKIEAGKALVYLEYREDFQLGCSDISGNYDKNINFEIAFDLATKKIFAIGPVVPEPLAPNEEF
ncbi:MAG: hypothetical protein QNL04_02300 [SAR324 cluster bacterium]|nr:hypothetical protein [SAR324 cluster bacterium]